MRSVIFAFLLNIGLVGWAAADEPKDVSMIQLIVDPQRFDGQTIRVIGFVTVQSLWERAKNVENQCLKALEKAIFPLKTSDSCSFLEASHRD